MQTSLVATRRLSYCAREREVAFCPITRSIAQHGMVLGMGATAKVTVTLPVGDLGEIKALVLQGQAMSVSGFVQHAVRNALDDVSGWRADLAVMLNDSGGPLSGAEYVWAAEALGIA